MIETLTFQKGTVCECERGLKFKMEHARNATSPSAQMSKVNRPQTGLKTQSNRRCILRILMNFDDFGKKMVSILIIFRFGGKT